MDSFDSGLTPCPTCQGNGTYQDGQKCDDCNGRTKDVVFHDTPDILALQARVQQLEAALLELRKRLEYEMPGCFIVIDDALNAPPLDVSPLWRVLKYAVVYEGISAEGGHCRNMGEIQELKFRAELACSAIIVAVLNLTPELRALITEMSKGGQG